MIQQMWPYIGEYVRSLLTTTITDAINQNLPNQLKPFKFEAIDLGDIVQ